MPITIEARHRDPTVKKDLLDMVQRVIGEFQSLPTSCLLIFLDDSDAEYFRKKWGPCNRGFFTPLNGEELVIQGIHMDNWPEYITRHFLARDPDTNKYVRDSETGRILLAYEQAIYLYGTTCADSVGRVMTLAHEFQHSVQYVFHQELRKKNHGFYRQLPDYEIPIEKEARIIAKRVAEKLCGKEQVDQYIARKINEANCHINSDANFKNILENDEIKQWKNEAEDWRFIQTLGSNISYNLTAETEQVARRLAENISLL